MLATAPRNAPTAALTAADFYVHMQAIMSKFSNTISAKLGQTIDASRETSQESTMLIRDEIQTMSNSLKADMITNHDELSKGLKELGQHISHEVAAAITTTSEQANNLNQASLQTIVDLLQNQ
jgi:archaellum component FlaC